MLPPSTSAPCGPEVGMAEVQEVSEEVYLGEGFQEDLAIKARDQTAEKRLNAGD